MLILRRGAFLATQTCSSSRAAPAAAVPASRVMFSYTPPPSAAAASAPYVANNHGERVVHGSPLASSGSKISSSSSFLLLSLSPLFPSFTFFCDLLVVPFFGCSCVLEH
ncbi:hypothetical protein PAHAL_5G320900 [Panicum hallii]|uniref:Uncharacterized protein n=1 Tax=Panicum hallii TaxID=206008 RepID=A0A2S3HVL6_9POAL|nr:hypothetical protein PAHAL_5G320900 [Panicum hallii]